MRSKRRNKILKSIQVIIIIALTLCITSIVYGRSGTEVKVSTSSISLDINGNNSQVITVSQNYPKTCYLELRSKGVQCVSFFDQGWNKTGTAKKYTIRGTKKGSFQIVFLLYDYATKKVVATSNIIKINVKASPKSNGGEKVYNIAKANLKKKYKDFTDYNFHFRAWCADFVSFCASEAGQSKAIPKSASVNAIRTNIKKAGGKEYSKNEVKKGTFIPKRGDIIIFKSSGASHVGIIDYVKNSTIYYIDGNNTTYGNGYSACVHYSNCSFSDKRFTCVLRPAYN